MYLAIITSTSSEEMNPQATSPESMLPKIIGGGASTWVRKVLNALTARDLPAFFARYYFAISPDNLSVLETHLVDECIKAELD